MSKKRFEWEGEEVSRSTYFRRKRKSKRAARRAAPKVDGLLPVKTPGDLQRAGVAAAFVVRRRNGHVARTNNELVQHERVETFMLMAEGGMLGDDNERVVLKVPRKILVAAADALREAGY